MRKHLWSSNGSVYLCSGPPLAVRATIIMADKLADVDCKEVHRTYHPNGETKAIKIDDGIREVWLPFSLIEIEDHKDGTITVTLPEKLAQEKELI